MLSLSCFGPGNRAEIAGNEERFLPLPIQESQEQQRQCCERPRADSQQTEHSRREETQGVIR